MKQLGGLFVCLFIACMAFGQVNSKLTRGVNGGVDCATCFVIVSLVEQLGEIHNESVVNSTARLCSYLPGKYQQFCKEFVDAFGPILFKLIEDDANPDRVCASLDFCRTDPGRQSCRVFSPHSTAFEESVLRGRDIIAKHDHHHLWHLGINFCELPGIKDICLILERVFNNHVPMVDSDVDLFSTYPTMRGASWRGKDCNDLNSNIYPGALPIDGDHLEDSNCNGIYEAFKHLDFIIENEIDWPEMSTASGHGFNNWTEVIQGPIDSLYLRLWQRNHCNHRDYQNIGVNGADSFSMVKPIMESLARKQQTDQPLVVIYALVGNDVCNGHTDDTFAHMTTPAQMKANVMDTLIYLDKKLPYNSTVFLVGLADGRVLYDSLKDHIHPIGRYWNKFTYSQFYDFFNCLQISPCSGWMNTNGTIRNMTTEGGQTWQLLEPVDGFHSNQYGQALTAQVTWEEAEKLMPQVFGPVNPANEKIAQIFGSQGGY
ncbi:hypothetical protein C0Q70_18714 [Pomacea canaliculata]|uniref:Saposin B-type domain-containing protein n=1 Tax=Pomacea canaliculata TaxID=400727 RepID=A0A2T7NHC7_POMCA|nr:hypothetical protein C0Q70_18714 [Pomacea canaliculata]